MNTEKKQEPTKRLSAHDCWVKMRKENLTEAQFKQLLFGNKIIVKNQNNKPLSVQWDNTEFKLVESSKDDNSPCLGECEFSELKAWDFPCNYCIAYCDRKYYPKSIKP